MNPERILWQRQISMSFQDPCNPIGIQRKSTGSRLGNPSFSRPEAETEPETRLWKVCAEAACPRHSGFEWVAFLVLGILALGVLAYSFSGLSLLVSTDDFDRTVRVLLGTS